MENSNQITKIRPFKARPVNRDDRPWNNSFLRLLVHLRCVDDLEVILDLCDEALRGLYSSCNSDEVIQFYWDLRGILIFLRTAIRSARTFDAMQGKRDAGEPWLCNGLSYFLLRVGHSEEILKELAAPCSKMPREVFSRLSESLSRLCSLCLTLRQDSLRKRSKKNRNKTKNLKAEPQNQALLEESDYSSSDDQEPGALTI